MDGRAIGLNVSSPSLKLRAMRGPACIGLACSGLEQGTPAITKAFNSAHLMIPANQTKRTTRSCNQPILSRLQYLNVAALLPLECFRVDSLTSLGHCTITCAKLKCQSKAYVLVNVKHPFPQIEGQPHRIMAGHRRLGFAARYCCLPRRAFSTQSKNNASRAS